MATDEALAYLIMLSVPVWLLLEQAIVWLKSRRQHDRETEAVSATRVVPEDPPEATRKAA